MEVFTGGDHAKITTHYLLLLLQMALCNRFNASATVCTLICVVHLLFLQAKF